MELVPLTIIGVDEIGAIIAVDHILALASMHHAIVAGSPAKNVIALLAKQHVGVPPAVEDVAAGPSLEFVCGELAAYLVATLATVEVVRYIGSGELAAAGAAGHVVGGIEPAIYEPSIYESPPAE
jgi:hypothetical protein